MSAFPLESYPLPVAPGYNPATLGEAALPSAGVAVFDEAHELFDHDVVVESRVIPGMPPGFYNAAAWQEGDDVYLLGRYLEKAGESGKGDPGPMVLVTLSEGAVSAMQTVWEPEEGGRCGDQLEDPRVVHYAGAAVLAFSRLAPVRGRHVPFPAVAVTSAAQLKQGLFPETRHIAGLGTMMVGRGHDKLSLQPGKNTTPIGGPAGAHDFMFRANGDNHALTFLSLDQDLRVQRRQRVELAPNQIPLWGQDTIGTTMPPVWLNDNEALLILHGFTRDGDGRPQYVMGSARLCMDQRGTYSIDNISRRPILTPGALAALFPGEQVQMHPEERDAMYMCGGVVAYDGAGEPAYLHCFPSVGDTRTVASMFDIRAITNTWQRAAQRTTQD